MDRLKNTVQVPPSKTARIYAEVVAITVAAAIVLGVAGVYLLGEARSNDGLSGPEITLLVTGGISALNQLSIWRNSAQVREVARDVNGRLDARLDMQTVHIDDDARSRKRESDRDADIR